MAVDDHLYPLLALDPHALACPAPHFARLREEAPVVWWEEQQHFVVTGHAEILEILRDPQTFSNQSAGSSPRAAADLARVAREVEQSDELAALRASGRQRPPLVPVLASTDPPVHGRHRAVVSRAFTPRRVAEIEPTIAELADGLIDGFEAAGHADFVGAFAMPLSAGTLARTLGVDPDAVPSLQLAARDLTRSQGNPAMTTDDFVAVLRAHHELTATFQEALERRRVEPLDDLLSALVRPLATGETLEPDEQLGMAVQLWGAGVVTASKLLANGLSSLLDEERLRSPIVDDPAVLEGFLEEVLRLEGPVQGLYRTATDAASIGGVEIPAGSCLWLVYAAGNRDPLAFVAPDVLDPDRPRNPPHLAFGHGIHHCVGASLARAEARIGWQRLLARLPDVTADGPPTREPSYVLHGLKTLPIRFTPNAQQVGV